MPHITVDCWGTDTVLHRPAAAAWHILRTGGAEPFIDTEQSRDRGSTWGNEANSQVHQSQDVYILYSHILYLLSKYDSNYWC